MFDLSLVQINHADTERALADDLRNRRILKATAETPAVETPAAEREPLRTSVPVRPASRARALGR